MGRAALAIGLVLAAGVASAGTEVVTETRHIDGSDDRVRNGSAFFDGRRMRLDTNDGRRAIVYRGDRNLIWVIDHKRQNYIEVEKPTPADVAKQAKARLDALPAEQRAAADVAAAAASSGVELRETGRMGRVNGIPCREVEVHAAGVRTADVCRASYADAGVTGESFAAVREVQELLGGSLAALVPSDTRAEGLGALESFAELDGVPMRVRTFDEGRPRTETVVKRIQTTAFPAGTFDLPDGYRPQFSINIRQ